MKLIKPKRDEFTLSTGCGEQIDDAGRKWRDFYGLNRRQPVNQSREADGYVKDMARVTLQMW